MIMQNIVGRRSQYDVKWSEYQCGRRGRFRYCSGDVIGHGSHSMPFCDEHLKRVRKCEGGGSRLAWLCADCYTNHDSKPEVYGRVELDPEL